jgi:hypothetical protein
MYVYQADTWCDSCGRKIADELEAEGNAPAEPDDERTYDSDEYPKHAAEEPTDGPDHCAAREDCLEAIELADYGLEAGAELYGAEVRKIGAPTNDGLTEHGAGYLAELLAEADPTPYQRALYRYWRELYAEELR